MGFIIILFAINLMISKTYGYYELTGFAGPGFTTPRFGGLETYCAQHGAEASYAKNDVDTVADIRALSGQIDSYPQPYRSSPAFWEASGSGIFGPAESYALATGKVGDMQSFVWGALGQYGGTSVTDPEALAYAKYYNATGGRGPSASWSPSSYELYSEPSDVKGGSFTLENQPLTLSGGGTVGADRDSGKYRVGPFTMSYRFDRYEPFDWTLAGITNMWLEGDNGQKISIDTIYVGDKAITPSYYQPGGDGIQRGGEQEYPKPGETFYVEFSDPNVGRNVSDFGGRVKQVKLKVTSKVGAYVLGPTSLSYGVEKYGSYILSGITEMHVAGANMVSIIKGGEEIKDLTYFEPDAEGLHRGAEPNCPKPGESFLVVVTNPNKGASSSSVQVEATHVIGAYYLPPTTINYVSGEYGGICFAGMTGLGIDSAHIIEYIGRCPKSGPTKWYSPDSKGICRVSGHDYPKPGESIGFLITNPNSPEGGGTVKPVASFGYMYVEPATYRKWSGSKLLAYSYAYEYEEDEETGERYAVSWIYRVSTVKQQDCISMESRGRLVVVPGRKIPNPPPNLKIPKPSPGDYGSSDEQEAETGFTDITIKLGGKVFVDSRGGKETMPDGMSSGDALAEGVEVTLYEGNDTVVGGATAGTYSFDQLDAMRQYYVESRYNGQQYENTIYANVLDGNHSTATETTGDRDAFNKQYEEVSGGYTIGGFEYQRPGEYPISAYTGSDGKAALVMYPEDSSINPTAGTITIAGQSYKGVHESGKDIDNIDFGITERIEFDMAVKKDVYAATVKINGKAEVYGYDKKNISSDDGQSGDTWTVTTIGGYERGLDNADWEFAGRNGNTEQLLEVYVTYKVAVRNQSMSMLGHVTRLYDYFADTYEYQPNLSWQSGTNYTTSESNLENLQDCMQAGSTGSFGASPNASGGSGTVTIDVGKKQKSGETQYIYLTFKVKTEDGRVILGTKTNSVEIGSFKTYYAPGTVLPHYAGTNGYTVSGDSMIAGRFDKDSVPSTMGPNGSPSEDDEDDAPGINILLTGNYRVLNGTVWEDERDTASGDASIGNGIMDRGETKIAGVQVELVEKTVWNGGGEYVWFTTTTGEDGKYQFNGYIPGDYVVRFTYGEGLSGASNNNGKSYNGQDYKSTTYQAGISQTGTTDLEGRYQGYENVTSQNETGTYGYNIATKKEDVSDAKDIWSKRQAVNNYSTNDITNHIAEVLASTYDIPNYNGTPYGADEMNGLLQELINKTTMTAESGVVVVEVERNIQSTPNVGTPSYGIQNLNLGLVERPKAQLEIDKSITNIKLVLANNSVLFDTKEAQDNVIWKDHTEYDLASKKDNRGMYNEYYGRNGKHRYSYRETVDSIISKADKGLVQLTMDEELMHGATIEISYILKVTNVGETDYLGEQFYYLGTGGSEIVTTRANQVVDYVANNLKFEAKGNDGWSLVKKEDLLSNGLVNNKLSGNIAKFNSIIQTEALNAILLPGESTQTPLVLTQLITSENKQDDLTYSNIVEIVRTSNTAGRRMAYSVVGNQNPEDSKAAEVDASLAERVIILPPFGDTHIYYILGAVISIILIAGITFTIKKVLPKKE